MPQAVEVGIILPSLMAQMRPHMTEESSRLLMQGQWLQSVKEVAAKSIIQISNLLGTRYNRVTDDTP